MQRIYVSVNKMAITSNHAQQDFVWSLKRWDTWSLIWIHLSSLACNTLIFHEGHSWFHATAQMSPPWCYPQEANWWKVVLHLNLFLLWKLAKDDSNTQKLKLEYPLATILGFYREEWIHWGTD
jgi:hypothetical protein